MNTTFLTSVLLAAAEEGHGHGAMNYFEIGSMFFNTVLFFGFLTYLAKKPLQEFLVTRRSKLAEKLEHAQSRQKEAEKRLSEYSQRLANLEDEVRRVVHAFEAEGRAEADRLRGEADRAIERLKREVDFTLRQESLKAIRQIREAGVEATLAHAETLISERITDADRRRLTGDYITKLAPPGSVPPRGEPS